MLEAYLSLAHVAAITERIRLSALVTGATYRHPGLLAKTVTTLDRLSGGRALLGIGAGWYEREHDGLGVPFPSTAERFERLEETLQICLQMWSDDNGSYDGAHFQLAETVCVPRAVAQPHPPIMVGGAGEKKTLRFVAQYAQWCNIFGSTPELMQHKLEVLRGHCEAAGTDYDAIRKTMIFEAGDPLADVDGFVRDDGGVRRARHRAGHPGAPRGRSGRLDRPGLRRGAAGAPGALMPARHRRLATIAGSLAAISVLAVGCGDDDGGEAKPQETETVTVVAEDESGPALTQEQLDAVVLTPENVGEGWTGGPVESDEESGAPGCFGEIEAISDGLDPLEVAESDVEYEYGAGGAPSISNGASSYQDLKAVAAAFDQLSTAGTEYDLTLHQAYVRIGKNVITVGVTDVSDQSELQAGYTQIAIDRLVAVIIDSDPSETTGPQPV